MQAMRNMILQPNLGHGSLTEVGCIQNLRNDSVMLLSMQTWGADLCASDLLPWGLSCSVTSRNGNAITLLVLHLQSNAVSSYARASTDMLQNT